LTQKTDIIKKIITTAGNMKIGAESNEVAMAKELIEGLLPGNEWRTKYKPQNTAGLAAAALYYGLVLNNVPVILEEVALAARTSVSLARNKKVDIRKAAKIKEPEIGIAECLNRYLGRFEFADESVRYANELLAKLCGDEKFKKKYGERGPIVVAVVFAAYVKQYGKASQAKICKTCGVKISVFSASREILRQFTDIDIVRIK